MEDDLDGEFLFEVEGSRKRPYSVRVRLDEVGDKRKKAVIHEQTFCDCPYFQENDSCKHVAAALLVLSEFEVVSPQINLWSDSFDKSKKILASKKPDKPKFPTQYQVADEDWDRILEILPFPQVPKINFYLYRIQLLEEGIGYTAHINGYSVDMKLIYSHESQTLKLNFPDFGKSQIPYIFQFIRLRFLLG